MLGCFIEGTLIKWIRRGDKRLWGRGLYQVQEQKEEDKKVKTLSLRIDFMETKEREETWKM